MDGDRLDRCVAADYTNPMDRSARMSRTVRPESSSRWSSTTRNSRPRSSRRRTSRVRSSIALCALLASSLPSAMAQNCISLSTSTACPAFNASSISTDSALVGLFPFLSTVSDTASFDSGLLSYISNGFTRTKYQQLLGCSNVQLSNSSAYYARFTTSVLCNAIVQNSITACGLSGNATRPLCADSCAQYAQSEQEIVASNLCSNPSTDALSQIRADFTNCALPANALTGSCLQAVANQPDNCGFSDNLSGLCGYCAASSPNATDSCCVFSNTTSRCTGVSLPVVASALLQPVTVTATTTTSGSSTVTPASSSAAAVSRGLTGGQIAGIVVGSVLGALFLLALVIGGCMLLRRHRDRSPATSLYNQPATSRAQPMVFHDGAKDIDDYGGLGMTPGGRVARMSALEGSSNSDRDNPPYILGAYSKSVSEEDTPDSRLAPPPKRSGSLSSGSQLAMAGLTSQETSPSSNTDQYPTPESQRSGAGVGGAQPRGGGGSQQQSEQLAFFKDYYSQDEIHRGDVVSTLWAYEPRAADEFALERGDMIKVLGIWDDGWATGVRVRQRADDWRPEGKVQRDSGLSTAPSSRGNPNNSSDPNSEGEVKAFPLVCVCLPQYWRKTIEGDSAET